MTDISYDAFMGRPTPTAGGNKETMTRASLRVSPEEQARRDALSTEIVQDEHAVEDDPKTRAGLERELARKGAKPLEQEGISFDAFMGKPATAPAKPATAQPEEMPSVARRIHLGLDDIFGGALGKVAGIGQTVASSMEQAGAAVNRFYDPTPNEKRASRGKIITAADQEMVARDPRQSVDFKRGKPDEASPGKLARGVAAAGEVIALPFNIASKEIQTFATDPVQKMTEAATGGNYGEAGKKMADLMVMLPAPQRAGVNGLRQADAEFLKRFETGVENRAGYPAVEHVPYTPATIRAAGPELTAKQQIETSLGIQSEAAREAYNKSRQADVKAAFKDDKDYANYLEFLASERLSNEAAYKAQEAARQAAVEEARVAAEAVAAYRAAIGSQVGQTPKGRMAEGRPLVEEAVTPQQLPSPEALETALEKVRAGMGFNLTAEEKIALRGMTNSPSPIIQLEQVGGGGRAKGYYLPEGKPKLLGEEVGQTQKTRMTEPVVLGAKEEAKVTAELEKPLAETDLGKALVKMRDGQGFDMTVAERRAYWEATHTNGPQRIMLGARIQRGEVDPELLKYIAGGSVGALTGAAPSRLIILEEIAAKTTRSTSAPLAVEERRAARLAETKGDESLLHGTSPENKALIEQQGKFSADGGKRNYSYSEFGPSTVYFTRPGGWWLDKEAAKNGRAVSYDSQVETRLKPGTKIETLATDADFDKLAQRIGLKDGKELMRRLWVDDLREMAAVRGKTKEQYLRAVAKESGVSSFKAFVKQQEEASKEFGQAPRSYKDYEESYSKIYEGLTNNKAAKNAEETINKIKALGIDGIEVSSKYSGDLAARDQVALFSVEKALPKTANNAAKALMGPGGKRVAKGEVDPELLKYLTGGSAGALTGAAADRENPLRGAALGGMAGLGGVGILSKAGRAAFGEVVSGLDKGLGALSTRIGNISEPLKLSAREYERRTLQNTHTALADVDPFLQKVEGLKGPGADLLKRTLLTGNPAKLKEVLAGMPELAETWGATKKVLDSYKEKLTALGRFKGGAEEYFPRVVTDKEGLLKALGNEPKGKLESTLAAENAKSIKTLGRTLTDLEESKIINDFLKFVPEGSLQQTFTKGRKVQDVTEALAPFYASPADALHRYLRSATAEIERAKFFGKDAQHTATTTGNKLNLDASIGNVVQRELASGKITGAQAEDLRGMLEARFKGGEKPASAFVQNVKNLANAGLLGSVVSAATQLGDLGTTVYAQGLRPTLEGVVKKLTGKQAVSVKDFGLADHISEEFTSQRKSAIFLNKVFKYSGFSAVDQFGKDVTLNAALMKAQRQAGTEKGQLALMNKYARAYGDEFPALLADLKAGNKSERVKSLLFSELSDLQPVSRMELPQKYLENPNGRIVYMLKTFMLKQADIVRRDAFQEIAKGNVAKGVSNLTKYALVLGISGATTDMVKDFLMGKKLSPKWMDIADNIFKTFGWSQYAVKQATSGHPLKAIGNTIVPPYQMFDDILRADPKAVQYIPLVGKLFYNWEMGGNDSKEEKKEKKRQQREMGFEDSKVEQRRMKRAMEAGI